MALDDQFVSRMLLIGLAIVVLVILVVYYQRKSKGVSQEGFRAGSSRSATERFSEPQQFYGDSAIIGPSLSAKTAASQAPQRAVDGAPPAQQSNSVMPSEVLDNEDFKAVDFETASKLPTDCFPRDRLTAQDLLPKDAANSKWAQVNPAGQGDVDDQNFLTAGYLIGINTVGQTNRNPNYQLRSEPLNPRYNTGPWNQTTIEGDTNRRMFEVGTC